MAYTYKNMIKEVGDSTDWKVGLRASIKKWDQIIGGDDETYEYSRDCGICVVAKNVGASKGLEYEGGPFRTECQVCLIHFDLEHGLDSWCPFVDKKSPRETLAMLREALEKEK